MRKPTKNRKRVTLLLLAGSCLLAAGISGGLRAAAREEIEFVEEDAAVVTIPAAVTSIDPADFYKKESVQTILVEKGNKAFCSRDGILYNKEGTKLLVYPAGRAEHVIPEGTTVIGSKAFIGQQIEKITFPDTLTELEENAFLGAVFPEGTVLHLPPSLRTIGDYALWLLKPVKCVFVPASVRSLGHWGVHADIAILQGKDTQLDEYPFFRETGGMLVGGLPGSTAEALLEKKANDKYSFAVLGEDGRIAPDPSWVYVNGVRVYNGKPIEPLYGVASEAPLQFRSNAKLLLSCSNNVNAGRAVARVSVDDEVFFGTIERDYMIPPASVAGCRVAKIPEQVYTGQPIRPKVDVIGLTEGVDYTVYYSDNTEVGLAYAVIYGKGNYGSKKTVSFRIAAPASAKPETGTSPGRPTIEWTVSTENGANVGTGRDLWASERDTTVRALPRGTTISSLKAGKRKITVRWKKVSGVKGYQIQYSMSRNFKSRKKTRTVSGAGNSKCVLKGLKAKKRYYVRIRTYKKVNGKKKYSAWSAAPKVKVK